MAFDLAHVILNVSRSILEGSLNISFVIMAGAPSMALRIQTFNYYGAFSRYTPCNKRAHSAPVAQNGHTNDDNQCKFKRIKSESAIDVTISEPLTKDCTYTFDYRTITFDGQGSHR